MILHNDWDGALKYRSSFLPSCLYKFYSLSGTDDDDNKDLMKLETLRKKHLWVSSPESNNDPFEYKGLCFNKEKLLEHISEKTFEICMRMFDRIDHLMYLASFIGKSDISPINNAPMWAYYANNHCGFCVEFLLKEKTPNIRELSYEPKRIDFTKMFLYSLEKEVTKEKLLAYILYPEKYSIKSDMWKHEHEYRFLYMDEMNLDALANLDLEIQSKNGIEIPYEEYGLSVDKIYVGINCSDNHQKRVIEIAKEIGANLVYKMKLSKNEFAFEEDILWQP